MAPSLLLDEPIAEEERGVRGTYFSLGAGQAVAGATEVVIAGLPVVVATVGEGEVEGTPRREGEGPVEEAAAAGAAALSATMTGRGGMVGGEGDAGDGKEDEGTTVGGCVAPRSEGCASRSSSFASAMVSYQSPLRNRRRGCQGLRLLRRRTGITCVPRQCSTSGQSTT